MATKKHKEKSFLSFYNFLRYFANFVFYFSYGNKHWGIFHVCEHNLKFLDFAVGWSPFLSVRTLEKHSDN